MTRFVTLCAMCAHLVDSTLLSLFDSLQRSLGKARAELIDPAVEERRRQRLYQKSLEEKRNGSETPVSPKKKPPKKMTQSVRENTLDLGLHPTPPISNR